LSSIDRVTERFGVCECKLQVPPDHLFVLGFQRRYVQQARDPGYVIVREQIGGVFIQKPGGDENFELLVPIELQDAADTVQDIPADAPLARFEPAKRAAVDLGPACYLFLSQAAIAAQPRQNAS